MAKLRAVFSVKHESCDNLTFRLMSFTWVPIPSLFTTPFIPFRNQDKGEEAMASLSHFEMSGSELVKSDEKVSLLFEKVGWGQFFRCFNDHNVEVTKLFALSLK